MIEDVPIKYILAEDLVVQKIIAGRPRDLEDARSILEIQGKKLDTKKIDKTLRTLAKDVEDKEWLTRWKQIKEEVQE
jgi:DNA-directed RNA polymerase subunit F